MDVGPGPPPRANHLGPGLFGPVCLGPLPGPGLGPLFGPMFGARPILGPFVWAPLPGPGPGPLSGPRIWGPVRFGPVCLGPISLSGQLIGRRPGPTGAWAKMNQHLTNQQSQQPQENQPFSGGPSLFARNNAGASVLDPRKCFFRRACVRPP